MDFICTNRSPLFLLLKPFIENFVETQTCETEIESQLRKTIQLKLNCLLPTNIKCNNSVLGELIEELNMIKIESSGEIKSEGRESRVDQEDKYLSITKDDEKSLGSSSPSRNIAFKYNKTKNKENHSSQIGSLNTTPRKKLEKLNRQTGTNILEVYKAKLKAKVNSKEIENEQENLTIIDLLISNGSMNDQKLINVTLDKECDKIPKINESPLPYDLSQKENEIYIEKDDEKIGNFTTNVDNNKKPKLKKIIYV